MNASRRIQMLWGALCSCLLACFSARANVYATDIQMNGSLAAGVFVPGSALTISYVLNDTATAGVSVKIYAGSNAVRNFTSDRGEAGTNAGLNTVVWDGVCNNGSNAPQGVYTVSIIAASLGYDVWTNITGDGSNFQVFKPSGIAVNKNTNSPYYGRVFVGNIAAYGGQNIGLFKYNADGSAADEGGFSTGGYDWSPNGYSDPSPWKMDIAEDDRLYVDDWSGNGVVISFDQLLSTNFLPVLRPDNYPYANVELSGPCVRGAGTNTQIFMADVTPAYLGGMGIIGWTLDAGGVTATNDTGTVVIPTGGDSDLTWAPYAVAVDTHWNIYTIQQLATNDMYDPVLCFPPYLAANPPDTNALWEIGAGDPTLINAYGVAVDPSATYAAVAIRGAGRSAENAIGGGLSVFLASDGWLVTNITTDPSGDTNQVFIDVAWDNAGNLYALDFTGQSVWRVYSPPGSNQMTTVAVPIIQVLDALEPPELSAPSACVGQLNFTLTGQSNVTYVIQQSPDLMDWIPVATNYSPQPSRSICVPFADAQDFYRAVASP